MEVKSPKRSLISLAVLATLFYIAIRSLVSYDSSAQGEFLRDGAAGNIIARQQLTLNEYLIPDGFSVPFKRVGSEYWFEPAPKGADWVLVHKIKLYDNIFYPVYYTPSGYQVIRKAKNTHHYTVHAYIDGQSILMMVDTGASVSRIGGDQASRLGYICEGRLIEAQEVNKSSYVCLHQASALNINGISAEKITDSEAPYEQVRNPLTVSFSSDKRTESINLLGFNALASLDFVIKEHFMYIKPSRKGRFTLSPSVSSMIKNYKKVPN